MIYKDFKGLKLSALGLGAMRFPTTDQNTENIDEALVEEMIDYSIKNGINYFDTAWRYHEGKSQVVLGKYLSKYDRSSFYLANKFPCFGDFFGRIEEIFEEQLKLCRVDYFDFYLFHNVCESNIDTILDDNCRLYEYLLKQKHDGRIRHLGFSCHGDLDVIRRFLDKFGSEIEFCQLQLNYFDWQYQKAKEKVELVSQYGIPVWVMEPLRGGKLATIQPEYEETLKSCRSDETVPAWAFRFLQSLPEVVVTLSGMSSLQQVIDNVATFAEDKPLNPHEMETVHSVASSMISKGTIPCTSCRYCTEYCPVEIDIPDVLKMYNDRLMAISKAGFPKAMLERIPEGKRPTDCLACRSCESICPQQIQISDIMADISSRIK